MEYAEIAEELAEVIRSEQALCIGQEGSELSQARDTLKKKYLGHGYGADREREERGFSTYVDRTVLEAVEWAKPGLMRVFCGEDIIRFDPRTPEQEKGAEEATLYVNRVAFASHMFSLVHDVLADGLCQRAGWCVAHCPEVEERAVRRWEALDRAEAEALVASLEAEGWECRVARTRRGDGGEARRDGKQGGESRGFGAESRSAGRLREGAEGVGNASPSAAGRRDAPSGAPAFDGPGVALGGAPGGTLGGMPGKLLTAPDASGAGGGAAGIRNKALGAGANAEGIANDVPDGNGKGADAAGLVLDGNGCGTDGSLFEVTARRTFRRRELRIEPVPAEQVVISGDARSVEDARFIAHWGIRTASDLRREGFGDELIDSLPQAHGLAPMPEARTGLRVNQGGMAGGAGGASGWPPSSGGASASPAKAWRYVEDSGRVVAAGAGRPAAPATGRGASGGDGASARHASAFASRPAASGAGRGASGSSRRPSRSRREERRDAARRFRIWEGWLDFDADGDGIAEKIKAVWCGDGDACVVLSWEEWPLYRAPLFAACSVPLPHQAVGLCVADLVCDLQDMRTEMTRQYLDSLALANQGELVVNEGQMGGGVEYDSLLARGVGAVHRIRGDASITPLPVATSPAEALKGLEMSAQLVERRTGISSRTQSLSAEALQSTATGAAIMEEAINQRLELIARVYAETFFKPLGRYVLHLIKHWMGGGLDRRLTGRFQHFRPADWDPDMDISVAVGLGAGSRTRIMDTYRQIIQIQRDFMEKLGPLSPVRLHHLVYACHKLAEAAGLEAPERFFGSGDDARRLEAGAAQLAGLAAGAGNAGAAGRKAGSAKGAAWLAGVGLAGTGLENAGAAAPGAGSTGAVLAGTSSAGGRGFGSLPAAGANIRGAVGNVWNAAGGALAGLGAGGRGLGAALPLAAGGVPLGAAVGGGLPGVSPAGLAAVSQAQTAARKQALEERKAQEKMMLDRRKAVADAGLKAWESAQRIALDRREAEARLALKAMEQKG